MEINKSNLTSIVVINV